MKDNTWGNITWSVNFNAPYATDPVGANTTNGGGLSFGISVLNNVFWYIERVTGKVWFYSLSTGNQLWTYTEPNQFAFQGFSFSVHNGKAYTLGSMGEMHCFDAQTGQSLWNWSAPLQGNLETQGLTYTPLSLAFYVDNSATGRISFTYTDQQDGQEKLLQSDATEPSSALMEILANSSGD